MSFAPFAATWTDPQGEMALLHQMQPARRQFLREHLAPQHRTGLDVGCGGGVNALDLARLGYHMEAIELEQELIDVAQKESDTQQLVIKWQQSSIEDFQPQNQYDFICCYEVLEHLDEPEVACSKMLSWLKPGGLIFCSTLNQTLLSYVIAIGAAEYLLRELPIGTHEFEKFLPPQKLTAALLPAECQELRGMIYNPLEKTFFLGESLSVQYIGAWKKPDAS